MTTKSMGATVFSVVVPTRPPFGIGVPAGENDRRRSQEKARKKYQTKDTWSKLPRRRKPLSIPRPARVAFAAACLVSAASGAPAAEKLDRAAERWLKEVGLLILPDEETTYRALKDGSDRAAFEALFWARR